MDAPERVAKGDDVVDSPALRLDTLVLTTGPQSRPQLSSFARTAPHGGWQSRRLCAFPPSRGGGSSGATPPCACTQQQRHDCCPLHLQTGFSCLHSMLQTRTPVAQQATPAPGTPAQAARARAAASGAVVRLRVSAGGRPAPSPPQGLPAPRGAGSWCKPLQAATVCRPPRGATPHPTPPHPTPPAPQLSAFKQLCERNHMAMAPWQGLAGEAGDGADPPQAGDEASRFRSFLARHSPESPTFMARLKAEFPRETRRPRRRRPRTGVKKEMVAKRASRRLPSRACACACARAVPAQRVAACAAAAAPAAAAQSGALLPLPTHPEMGWTPTRLAADCSVQERHAGLRGA